MPSLLDSRIDSISRITLNRTPDTDSRLTRGRFYSKL
jgi:hypothetical protein